jgi:hypothetical protein
MNNNDLRILKLNIQHNNSRSDLENRVEEIDDSCNLEGLDILDDLDDLDNLDDLDENNNTHILHIEETNTSLKSEETNNFLISSTDLRTISVNLEEENENDENKHIDYKKLQLPKLRNIAIEKGLTTTTEASKLKKPDLIKMLEID